MEKNGMRYLPRGQTCPPNTAFFARSRLPGPLMAISATRVACRLTIAAFRATMLRARQIAPSAGRFLGNGPVDDQIVCVSGTCAVSPRFVPDGWPPVRFAMKVLRFDLRQQLVVRVLG